MKHTPGPWEASGYCTLDNAYHVGTIGPKGCTGIHLDAKHSIKELIADIWAAPQSIQSKANARLIAAAPDLLAACKVTQTFLAQWRALADIPSLGTLQAAIAKAEGA